MFRFFLLNKPKVVVVLVVVVGVEVDVVVELAVVVEVEVLVVVELVVFAVVVGLLVVTVVESVVLNFKLVDGPKVVFVTLLDWIWAFIDKIVATAITVPTAAETVATPAETVVIWKNNPDQNGRIIANSADSGVLSCENSDLLSMVFFILVFKDIFAQIAIFALNSLSY